jgi:hypothetical protein
VVWGMPKWGRENERGGEVRKGVRLVGMEEVSQLIRLDMWLIFSSPA